MPHRVLVVGAGITGSFAVRTLRRALGAEAEIEVWEQARGTGGRLSTTWGQAGNTKADMGAQYLSLDTHNAEAKDLYEELVTAGVIREAETASLVNTPERPEGSGWRHCYAPAGTSSALKHIIAAAGATLRTEHCVNFITAGSHGWRVGSKHGAGDVRLRGGTGKGAGVSDEFDAVLLCNGPGRLGGADTLDNISGGWQEVLAPKEWAALKSARYGRRYVVAFFLHPECLARCEHFFGEHVERLVDDDLVHLVAFQSRKVGTAGNGDPIAVVCHTIPEAAQPPKDKCLRAVQQWLLRNLGIEGPAEKHVLGSKIQTWGKCQVEKSTAHALHGRLCLASVEGSMPLAVCGDYFSGPTVTDALRSAAAGATAVAEALRHHVGTRHRDLVRAEAPAEGSLPPSCQECDRADCPVFRDKTDGQSYCRGCWVSYYGQAPPRSAEVAATSTAEVPSKQRKCGECKGMKDKLFLDKKNGVEYCSSCWVAYYGWAPTYNWEGA